MRAGEHANKGTSTSGKSKPELELLQLELSIRFGVRTDAGPKWQVRPGMIIFNRETICFVPPMALGTKRMDFVYITNTMWFLMCIYLYVHGPLIR